MTTVQERINIVQELTVSVKAHPMCCVLEDLGGAYRVLYPEGFRLDGAQCVYVECGKAAALQRLLKAMERHWELY